MKGWPPKGGMASGDAMAPGREGPGPGGSLDKS